MSINERIKLVRKKLKYNQTEFGKELGIGQGAASWIEQEGNRVIEDHIKTICDKFSIDEYWLRTGRGSMFIDHTLDLVDRLTHELNILEEERDILLEYLSYPNEERREIIELARSFLKRYFVIEYGGMGLSQKSDDIEIEKKASEYRKKL